MFFFWRSYFFIIMDKTINKSPSRIKFKATVSATMVIHRVSKFWSSYKRGREKSQILVINRLWKEDLCSGPYSPTKFSGSTPPPGGGGAVKHFHITIVMLFPFKRIWSSLVILRPSGVFSLLKLTINYWYQIKSVKFSVQLAIADMKLTLDFNSPVTLIFMCTCDIFGYFGWNILTTGRLTHNIKGFILNHSWCYELRHSLTTLKVTKNMQYLWWCLKRLANIFKFLCIWSRCHPGLQRFSFLCFLNHVVDVTACHKCETQLVLTKLWHLLKLCLRIH